MNIAPIGPAHQTPRHPRTFPAAPTLTQLLDEELDRVEEHGAARRRVRLVVWLLFIAGMAAVTVAGVASLPAESVPVASSAHAP